MSDTFEGVRPGNEIVEGQVVRLDFSRFDHKAFVNCTLVYSGGLPPTLVDCDFINSNFAFDGAALQTVGYLTALAGSGAGGRDLVLGLLGITQ